MKINKGMPGGFLLKGSQKEKIYEFIPGRYNSGGYKLKGDIQWEIVLN